MEFQKIKFFDPFESKKRGINENSVVKSLLKKVPKLK